MKDTLCWSVVIIHTLGHDKLGVSVLLMPCSLHAVLLLQLGELTKLSAESRDNVKFLTTLERHFKNITSGPLAGILDTLPPMMNALRMVRVRHD